MVASFQENPQGVFFKVINDLNHLWNFTENWKPVSKLVQKIDKTTIVDFTVKAPNMAEM